MHFAHLTTVITRRRGFVIVAIVAGLVASWFIAQPLRPYLESNYGIDPFTVLVLFVCAEVFFDLGIALMLWFGGVRKLSWSAVRSLQLKRARVDWHHPGVFAGLLMNRVSWCLPFVYVIAAGWGRLPWFITGLAAAEIAVTMWIGALAVGIVGRRRPTTFGDDGERSAGSPTDVSAEVES